MSEDRLGSLRTSATLPFVLRMDVTKVGLNAWCMCLLVVGEPAASAATDGAAAPVGCKADSLSQADMEHGCQQVRQMLRDRPAMAKYVNETDVPWQWAAKRFAGEETGARVYWDPGYPDPPSDAESLVESGRHLIRVREVYGGSSRKGQPASLEYLWENVIFELFNQCNVPAFSQINQAVDEGRLSRDEYVRKIAELEYSAEVRTKRFYESIWRPWVERRGLDLDPFLVWHHLSPSFEAYLMKENRDGYPYEPYGSMYDSQMIYLISTGKLSRLGWRRVSPYVEIACGAVFLVLFIRRDLLKRNQRGPQQPRTPPDSLESQGDRMHR